MAIGDKDVACLPKQQRRQVFEVGHIGGHASKIESIIKVANAQPHYPKGVVGTIIVPIGNEEV